MDPARAEAAADDVVGGREARGDVAALQALATATLGDAPSAGRRRGGVAAPRRPRRALAVARRRRARSRRSSSSPAPSRVSRTAGAPAASAASRSSTGSSGSASTTTSAAPSSAAASVSAITSATGWPDHTISSRASGSAARPEPPASGRSACGEHGHDAGHRERRARVDARHPRVRLRRQHRPGVQQPVHRHVPHVARRAAHLRLAVPPAPRRPDHPPDVTERRSCEVVRGDPHPVVEVEAVRVLALGADAGVQVELVAAEPPRLLVDPRHHGVGVAARRGTPPGSTRSST